jgi:hypothetical protein
VSGTYSSSQSVVSSHAMGQKGMAGASKELSIIGKEIL